MLTNDDKALILLCSHVGINNTDIKPLTLKQWNDLANLITNSDIKRPENLFNMDSEQMCTELKISKADGDYIAKLLSRRVELGIELERLFAKGIKVITRANPMYPTKLRKLLKDQAPPVIFYCGNLSLANEDGIGIVGSRNLKEEYVEFTKKLVQKSVKENLVIFSGGARGIDDTSEKEAFNIGGRYVSFLADSLESKIKKKDVRDKINTNRGLLMTATKPDVGFSVGFAMNRNKFIYALSKGTFIIASDYKKGGTWAGATENLRHNWSKTFVRQDLNLKGIQELIKLGAIPIENINNINIREILDKDEINKEESDKIEQIDISSLLGNQLNNELDNNTIKNDTVSIDNIKEVDKIEANNYDLYNIIIETLVEVLREEKTTDELSEILNVNKVQLNAWLNRAVKEKKIKKIQKPVRYIGYNN